MPVLPRTNQMRLGLEMILHKTLPLHLEVLAVQKVFYLKNLVGEKLCPTLSHLETLSYTATCLLITLQEEAIYILHSTMVVESPCHILPTPIHHSSLMYNKLDLQHLD